MKIQEVLKMIFKLFRPTSADVSVRNLTVEEIAERMKPGVIPESRLPTVFAKTMAEILKEEGCGASR